MPPDDNSDFSDVSEPESSKGKGKASAKDASKPVKRRSSKACESIRLQGQCLCDFQGAVSRLGALAESPPRQSVPADAASLHPQATSTFLLSVYKGSSLLDRMLIPALVRSCRRQKTKCERVVDTATKEPVGPCANCASVGAECTYLGASRKRGPPKG